ncbi:MAG: hypothetical protein RBS89_07280 [Candidatus Delongbacteria bacterium]|jgi:hypothetical protein|nr:hypothetical protein [Candidatus Delongbacteria bacterium]
MRFINEMIDYLHNANILTQDDFYFLQFKGYYKPDTSKDADYYWVKNMEDDDDEYYKEYKEDDYDLIIEPALADTRKRKQGRRARFKKHNKLKKTA